MSTNAIISIVRDGNVITKIICGCDGNRAEETVRDIISYMICKGDPTNIMSIYMLCQINKLGCRDCLVVMNETESYSIETQDEKDPETERRYRDTFDDPEFNPRTTNGKGASHIFIIPAL